LTTSNRQDIFSGIQSLDGGLCLDYLPNHLANFW
jgi:hypothetical protein